MVSTSSEGQGETGFNKEDHCQCLSPITHGGGGSGFADVGRQSSIRCRKCGELILKKGPKFCGSGRK